MEISRIGKTSSRESGRESFDQLIWYLITIAQEFVLRCNLRGAETIRTEAELSTQASFASIMKLISLSLGSVNIEASSMRRVQIHNFIAGPLKFGKNRMRKCCQRILLFAQSELNWVCGKELTSWLLCYSLPQLKTRKSHSRETFAFIHCWAIGGKFTSKQVSERFVYETVPSKARLCVGRSLMKNVHR